MAYVIGAADREAFRRCRRSWDFGAAARGNWEPLRIDPEKALRRAIREALAVYYFPGMWDWNRAIVRPLVERAFERAIDASRDEVGDERLRAGRSLVERYLEWAPENDRFAPIRVGTELEVNVPDPSQGDADLTTATGEPIRYRGRIDLLVEDGDGVHWLVHHRIGGERFATRQELEADERGIALCWAWEEFFLGMTIAGTIYGELRGPGEFRRTAVPRDRAAVAGIRAAIAADAARMTRPHARIDPCFSRENCSTCAFRLPCIAASERGDAGEALRVAYRKRTQGAAGAPRLGEMHSGIGRTLLLSETRRQPS